MSQPSQATPAGMTDQISDTMHASAQSSDDGKRASVNEKEVEVGAEEVSLSDQSVYVPDEKDEFIDPRLKDYPIPLVAKTVDLHNDDT